MLVLSIVTVTGIHDLSPASTVSIGVRRVASLLAVYAVGMTLVFLLYRMAPNTRVPARAAAVATIAAAALWELARWVFGAWVGRFGVYGALYGSFGIGVATLIWIYYSACIFVLGAELAAVRAAGAVGPPTGASGNGRALEGLPMGRASVVDAPPDR
jgi:YihY family inner membrane protein